MFLEEFQIMINHAIDQIVLQNVPFFDGAPQFRKQIRVLLHQPAAIQSAQVGFLGRRAQDRWIGQLEKAVILVDRSQPEIPRTVAQKVLKAGSVLL